MEPVYMILGHASGVAAALAVEKKTTVQQVPIELLRKKLKAHKAVLSPEEVPVRRQGARELVTFPLVD
jgi:hypothetical protein